MWYNVIVIKSGKYFDINFKKQDEDIVLPLEGALKGNVEKIQDF